MEEYDDDMIPGEEGETSGNKNIREIFRGLFGEEEGIEQKTDLTIDEITTLSLINIYNKAIKRRLGLSKGFNTIYDDFLEAYLKYRVSLNRRGRREIVEILKKASPNIGGEQEEKKGFLRRLLG